MKEVWSEKYRPKTFGEYVFKNEKQKKQIQQWISAGALPHLLISGPAGTGKTSAAFMMLNELGVDACDLLYINASVNNGVDFVRDRIVSFSETSPYGSFKYILMDEADFLSPPAQAALRGIMQDCVGYTRFILTCNYVNRIIDPVVSRCQTMTIESLDVTEFTAKVAEILITENVHLELDVLDTYVKKTYPDMRKCINSVQMNSYDGILNVINDDINSDNDVFFEVVNYFKTKPLKEARTFLAKNVSIDRFVEMYEFLYRHLDLFASTNDEEFESLCIIRKGIVDHSNCGCPEICLSATIAQLTRRK
jgi:replication factor C small subunit